MLRLCLHRETTAIGAKGVKSRATAHPERFREANLGVMHLSVLVVTHPKSNRVIDWPKQLSSNLQTPDSSVELLVSNRNFLDFNWQASFVELVLGEGFFSLIKFKYYLKTQSLLSALTAGAVDFQHHAREALAMVLSPRIRQLKRKQAWRLLDLNLTYESLFEQTSADSDWILSFEDDAIPRFTISKTAKTLLALIRMAGESEDVWVVDLSRSFSADSLGAIDPKFVPTPGADVEMITVSGRFSNTFCAVLFPAKTWQAYGRHLKRRLSHFGWRLIPCDWLLNDLASNLCKGNKKQTWLAQRGLFLQGSMLD